jgi:hypothetical protein
MNRQPDSLSSNQLQKVGADSSPSRAEKQLELAKATEISLRSISVPGLFKATNEQAWKEGTNIRTALRIHPEATRGAVISMVKSVCDFVEAKKTLQSLEGYALCAETIFDIFPTLKLEEFRLICDRMKTGYYGKYYERLKIQEFRECIIKHEEERAPILERINSHITRGSDSDRVAFQPQSMADLRRKRDPLYIPGLNEPKQSKEET